MPANSVIELYLFEPLDRIGDFRPNTVTGNKRDSSWLGGAHQSCVPKAWTMGQLLHNSNIFAEHFEGAWKLWLLS